MPALGDDLPPKAPVRLWVEGANVWVHAVALQWFRTEEDNSDPRWPTRRRTEEGGGGWCSDYAGPHTLPQKANALDPPIELSWPYPGPDVVEEIEADVWVRYSLTPDGRQELRPAKVDSIGWQGRPRVG